MINVSNHQVRPEAQAGHVPDVQGRGDGAGRPQRSAAGGQAVPELRRHGGDQRLICRTPDEAFAAGWADGADDKPLTPAEITQMVQLHARHLRPQNLGSCAVEPAPLPRRA